jgi:hypothetical protein
MVPILDQTIEGAKVSIFNEAVHAKYPLLGLRLKNTSGQPLTQGPITVYEDGSYAGDTRILDLQPNETRLLSYALDQSMEIKTQGKIAQSPELTAKIGPDGLASTYKIQQTKTYALKNRSRYDRKGIIEHPIRSDWNLIAPIKPAERTRDLYRFEVMVPPGKLVNFSVTEEQARTEQVVLKAPDNPSSPPYLRYFLGQGLEIQPVSRTILGERMELKILKNVLHARHKVREVKTYFVTNNSGQDRVFQIDHLVRPSWTLVGKGTGAGESPKIVRFKLPVNAGKTASHEVVEEQLKVDQFRLTIQEEKPARYVLGLGVEIQPLTTMTPVKLTELKIEKGMVKARYRTTETIIYVIKNNAEKDRVFAFDHLIRPDWKRLDPKGDNQRGPNVFRFELKIAAGKTAHPGNPGGENNSGKCPAGEDPRRAGHSGVPGRSGSQRGAQGSPGKNVENERQAGRGPGQAGRPGQAVEGHHRRSGPPPRQPDHHSPECRAIQGILAEVRHPGTRDRESAKPGPPIASVRPETGEGI